MSKIQLIGLFLNFIIYVLVIFPIFIIGRKKNIYINKKIFIRYLCYSILIEILLSVIFYTFPKKIFSIFTKVPGIINYATYASKIIFISSSLYSLKILIPKYIFFLTKDDSFNINFKNSNSCIIKITYKKTAIFLISKIAVNLLFIFIGFSLFNTKGALYSIPIVDLIYDIIYFIVFLKIIR